MTIAFLLFGMLQGINFGYAAVIEQQLLDRLLTDPKVPGGAPMPLSMKQKIESLPGVRRVCARAVFFGRAGQFADRSQGQQSRVVADPVGSFDNVDEPGLSELGLMNYEYFDAARANSTGTVDRFIIRIADLRRSAAMATAIDTLFANSPAETRTQNEKDQVESSIQQLGDVSFFTNSIVAAVFFALLFLTGNTMAQSVRERTAEIAVLETLGYSRRRIAAIVVAESTAPALLAAAIGLAIAAALFPGLRDVLGLARLSWAVVGWGALAALMVCCASALIPVWRISRMSIVAALGYRG